jgi:hypothetical protein
MVKVSSGSPFKKAASFPYKKLFIRVRGGLNFPIALYGTQPHSQMVGCFLLFQSLCSGILYLGAEFRRLNESSSKNVEMVPRLADAGKFPGVFKIRMTGTLESNNFPRLCVWPHPANRL